MESCCRVYYQGTTNSAVFENYIPDLKLSLATCHAPLEPCDGHPPETPLPGLRSRAALYIYPQVEPYSHPSRIRLTSILLSMLILLTPTYEPLTQL